MQPSFFQRAGYNHKDEFSTFVLLGCLREKDKEEIAWKAKLHCYWRNAKAKFIQHPFVAWYDGRKTKTVEKLQMKGRSYIAKKLVSQRRLQLFSQRKIKFFLVHAMVHRHFNARKIAFFWLKARHKRLLRHSMDNGNQIRLERLKSLERRRHLGSSNI